MIKDVDDCLDCGLPCIPECKYHHVPHFYCDECGEEVSQDDLYEMEDGTQVCSDCLYDYLLAHGIIKKVEDRT